MRTATNERPLSDLFRELSNELNTLISQEVRLAKVEMSQQVSKVGKDVTYMALGGALAYAGLLALMFAVVGLLAEIMPTWLAALIVGVMVAAIGGLMIQKGRSDLKKTNLVPQRTVETVKEDVEWARQEIR